ncbi:MAG: MBL fold hydrolase, partial [Candidatus Melainabacteria bacterium RIFOXYA2_FULL_32_9]
MSVIVHKVNDNVHLLRSIDANRKLFDELIPLPDGTSYNAYLIKGSEKTALIDTTYPPKIEFLTNRLKELGVDKLDYIISNHAEQDHSGAIPKLLEIYPEAKIVTNAKCKALIMEFLLVSDDKFIVVGDRETLSLGDKTLEFILAPWVHWPDTMFTYLKEDKILFSCDFLGSHLAIDDLFITDEDNVYKAAKRYYAEIMMPFRAHIKKHLEKIDTLEVDLIMPSHGPSYQNPDFILNAYKDWASDNVKNEVVIAYVSMYESTRMMVDYLSQILTSNKITVKTFDLIKTDIGELAMDIVDAATIVIASPTVLTGAHPVAANATYLVNALRPKTKFASIIGSFGWGGNMVEQLKGMLGNLKVELIEPVMIKGQPKEADFALLDSLAKEIINKHENS